MNINFKEEDQLVKKLLYESIYFDQATAYKSGFFLSIVTIIYYYINCLIRKSSYVLDLNSLSQNKTLCFWQFQNEKNAIDLEIRKDRKNWLPIEVNPRKCRGLNWQKVFWQNPFLIIKFIYLVKKNLGIKKLRSFAYGYIGYLVYCHLMNASRELDQFNADVLTANMVSPISVAINEFGRAVKLRTYYLEHAITPKSLLHGMQYDKYIVRLNHTKSMFIASGVPDENIILNDKYFYKFPPDSFRNLPFRDIGIAINDEDRIHSILNLIQVLVENNYKVFIRVHDGDKRFPMYKSFASKVGANIESAKTRHINEFLKGVDFIFVGNTTVLLDAIILGIPVAYIWPGEPYVYDYYGLVNEINCPVLSGNSKYKDVFDFYYLGRVEENTT